MSSKWRLKCHPRARKSASACTETSRVKSVTSFQQSPPALEWLTDSGSVGGALTPQLTVLTLVLASDLVDGALKVTHRVIRFWKGRGKFN